MKIHVTLWILIITSMLVTTQTPDLNPLVSSLTQSLSNAFKNLNVFINANDLAAKINTIPTYLTNAASLDILDQSKVSTESLVSQTSAVVDTIQQKITSEFVKFPKVVYSIDCDYSNNSFYFRSKAINNGTYLLTNCTDQTLTFTHDVYLDNILTSRQNSTVHIPTNVFDSSNEIQQVSNYVQNLDQTFALSESLPQIKWQFFCSVTGFFKMFPGIIWNIQNSDMDKDGTNVDFFDCRSQQWFLESSSRPKKMIIMVDRSGSMKGLRKIIANQTIYEILNTLTENDYFNVLLFAKEILFADNMTSILIQATDKNKMRIMNQLNLSFLPDGIAEYDVGLNASFSVLQADWNKENSSLIYNYLLMIITDGIPLNYQDIINVGNKNIQARIFTYLIGQGSTEKDLVKQMSCNNKGYFVEIVTLSDVKENVQKYLNVVARPNAIMKNSFLIWTGVNQFQMKHKNPFVGIAAVVPAVDLGVVSPLYALYNSSTQNMLTTTQPSIVSSPAPVTIALVQEEKIPLFVTVSEASYNTTPEKNNVSLNIGKLLGAAGVDVPVTAFLKTAPFWKIGVNAYLFGVTQNSYVMFHPRFRPQYKTYLKYFYRNVDIGEVEVSVTQVIKQINQNQTIPSPLRDSIITVLTGDNATFIGNLSTYDIVDDFKTAFKSDRSYFITGITGTPYKFGLAVPFNQVVPQYATLPDYNSMNLSVFSTTIMNGSLCNVYNAFANQSGVSLKPYEFCNINKEIAAFMLRGPLCALKEVINNQTLRKICLTKPNSNNIVDNTLDQYIKSLYNEANDTKYLPQEWSSKAQSAISAEVQQIFSMHHFGLIRYFNYKNLSYPNFISDHNATIEDPLYQETILTSTILQNKNVLVVRPLSNSIVKQYPNESILIFTVTTPIANGPEYKGIVGVQVNYQYYQNILMTSQNFNDQNLNCNNSSLISCYVVTTAGIVVLNNQNLLNMGMSLKDIDCILMESLVNNGIFQNQTLYDFQGLCTNLPSSVTSFASILIDPFTKFLRLTIWLIYEIITILQNISLTSLLWSFTFQETNPPYPIPTVYDGRPCYNQLSSYFVTTTVNSTSNNTSTNNATIKGTITCPLCTETWYATMITNTNLLLIVVYKQSPSCTCDCQSSFGVTKEITTNISQPIQNPLVQNANYYSQFIPLTKLESSSECSNAPLSTKPYKWLIILFLSFLLYFKII